MDSTPAHFIDHANAAPGTPARPCDACAGSPLTRANSEGCFSLLGYGPVSLAAEPGLVIRVHAGCLWVPHEEEPCSLGVGAGEHVVVCRGRTLTALAVDGTQLELQWPARAHADARAC